jgi:UDP-N-acetylenolpyruvoylglucosamine reductase
VRERFGVTLEEEVMYLGKRPGTVESAAS